MQWLKLQHCALTEEITQSDLVAHCTGYQAWLGRRLGLRAPANVMGALAAHDLPPGTDLTRYWRVEPVHYRLATDHIVLAQAGFNDLSADDAKALVLSLQALCEHFGLSLVIAASGRWYLHWNAASLMTSTSLCAIGRNIDIYLPRHVGKANTKNTNDAATDVAIDHARLWRRIATEIEMTWFNHSVNEARQNNGKLTINSLWLESACAVATQPNDKTSVLTNDANNASLLNSAGLALSQSFDPQTPTLIEHHDLNNARLESNAWEWLQAWQAMQSPLLAQMIAAQNSPSGLELVCFGERQQKTWTIKPKTTWHKLTRSGTVFSINHLSEPLQ